jgi:hypothetical protein
MYYRSLPLAADIEATTQWCVVHPPFIDGWVLGECTSTMQLLRCQYRTSGEALGLSTYLPTFVWASSSSSLALGVVMKAASASWFVGSPHDSFDGGWWWVFISGPTCPSMTSSCPTSTPAPLGVTCPQWSCSSRCGQAEAEFVLLSLPCLSPSDLQVEPTPDPSTRRPAYVLPSSCTLRVMMTMMGGDTKDVVHTLCFVLTLSPSPTRSLTS